jgi:hypothetical protein
MRFTYASGAVRAVGRGAEGRRLAEKLGAVRDGFGNGFKPMCRYLVEDLRMDVDDVGLMGMCVARLQALSF